MRRALAILALARAYEVYENEYANDVLPGGRGTHSSLLATCCAAGTICCAAGTI